MLIDGALWMDGEMLITRMFLGLFLGEDQIERV
jgi:hypothetical protein